MDVTKSCCSYQSWYPKRAKDEWIDRAERIFDFANSAKYWFEHGDFERKTTIIRGLGSNFLVKDKKVYTELQNPFVIFKKNSQLVSRPFSTLELKLSSSGYPRNAFTKALWAV